jgi:aspartyl-tRNA(Asn)/glutamyl-tRNA(Gln) amidotransferase subunit C
MKLEKKEIEHIANLARLQLTEEESKIYGEQLSHILNYIDQLKEVDTTGVEPTAQVTGLVDVMRTDEVLTWGQEEVKKALTQAPEMDNNQIKVKRIIQ